MKLYERKRVPELIDELLGNTVAHILQKEGMAHPTEYVPEEVFPSASEGVRVVPEIEKPRQASSRVTRDEYVTSINYSGETLCCMSLNKLCFGQC